MSDFSNVAAPSGPPIKVADQATAIPGGSGTFTSFGGVALALVPPNPVVPPNPIRVAFLGSGAGQQGVYAAVPGGPPIRVADTATAIPEGAGAFTSFGGLALAIDTAAPSPPPIRVAFLGSGAGQQGVYVSEVGDVALPTGPPIKVADLATAIPSGTGNFTSFSAVTASGGHVAFLGQGSGGQAGIYLASALTKVIAAGDTLDGKTVASLRLGQFGFDHTSLTFAATFTDGSDGVFTSSVNAVNFSGFFDPVDNLPVFNRLRAGQAVPVKFSLNGNQGLNIFAPGYPKSEQIACSSNALVAGIEQTVTEGSSSLSYDASTDRYSYVWKTEKSWSNTCRQLILRFTDGSSHRANFTLE